MGEFYNIIVGYFFGFALGVGCALAVMYTIYTNGYKRAIADSLSKEKPERYREALSWALKRFPDGVEQGTGPDVAIPK